MRRFTRKQRITAIGGVVALAMAGTAFAFWTGGGSGSGNATVGTNGAVTLVAIVPAGITPGNGVVVSFTAANATTSPIAVTTVKLSASNPITVDSGHSACAVADFTMADVSQVVAGLPHQVPAGATADALPTNGLLVFANTAVNQDACKGATLTLNLTSV